MCIRDRCRLPPIKGREMQVLTQEEMRRFLIQAKAEGMYELFLLDLTTGMRRGELLALRWDDLDFATGTLRIDKQICPVGGKLIVSEHTFLPVRFVKAAEKEYCPSPYLQSPDL